MAGFARVIVFVWFSCPPLINVTSEICESCLGSAPAFGGLDPALVNAGLNYCFCGLALLLGAWPGACA